MTTTNSKTPSHATNVYLFKNGYGMIVKTFAFPSAVENKLQCVELLDPPSNAVHGTFWVQSSSSKTTIHSIRTKKTIELVDRECLSVTDLVAANIGQDVELLVIDTTSRSKEWIAGQIKEVKRLQIPDDDDTITLSVNSSFAAAPVVSPMSSAHGSPIRIGDLVLFTTADHGLMALPLSTVQSIRGATLVTTYQQRVPKNCLAIDYRNESGSEDTGLMKYLTLGITWAPSYNLTLLSSNDSSVKRLRFTSRAVILNDIENMTVDNLFCVVGFPNTTKFASVDDPMLSTADVSTFLQQLKQCEGGAGRGHRYHAGNIMSNSIMTQQMMPMMSGMDVSVPDETSQDPNVDDLHLYEFKNIVLQRRERLMLPIFDVEVPYKDVYHCKVDSAESVYHHMQQSEKKQYEEVWHSVKFDNTTNFVLTTAPVLITKGQEEQQVIGQDTLPYTSKGSTTFVNLTKALDVRVQLDEKVLNTNSSRFTLFSYNYQCDQIEGKFSVMNFKSEEVVVVINTTLVGKMSNYSVPPKTDAVKTIETTANQRHDIVWEVTVKPKQTMEIKYTRSYNRRV